MEKILEKTLDFWDDLLKEEKEELIKKLLIIKYKKGETIYHSKDKCTGVYIFYKGRARVFMSSNNGGEITLFRLYNGDISILSASCMFNNLDFETNMEFEEDTEIYVIPKGTMKKISDQNSKVKEFILEAVSEKFSNVMWIFNQYVFSNMARRLATSLYEYRNIFNSDTLKITHNSIAKDLGTAREVVTRLLKQFQIDGIITMSRGEIKILNLEKLMKL
jgi:CRP/FNR family transcriptional regulator